MTASRALFSTGEPAYAVDHSGVIVAWNTAAEAAFGYTEAEALGQRCWELLAGRDVFGNHYCFDDCALRETAFHHGSINPHELYLKTSSRELKKFRVSTLLVADGPGNELLVHLCHPDCDASDECNTTICAVQPGNNHQRGNNHGRGALTVRETEVLSLLSEGKGTNEVAEKMCISPATVRNHIQHILYKLHVHSRIAAINLGQKIGLI